MNIAESEAPHDGFYFVKGALFNTLILNSTTRTPMKSLCAMATTLAMQRDCFNYLNRSQAASAASGSPPSIWMKLAHPDHLTFIH